MRKVALILWLYHVAGTAKEELFTPSQKFSSDKCIGYLLQ